MLGHEGKKDRRQPKNFGWFIEGTVLAAEHSVCCTGKLEYRTTKVTKQNILWRVCKGCSKLERDYVTLRTVSRALL